MKKLIQVTTSTVLLGASLTVNAALVEWGARARTSVADCPSFCTNFNIGPSLGGVNTPSTGISAVNENRGSARSSAALAGGFSTPVLKAESFADPSFNGAFGTSFGVQGYTYNGPGETLVLDVNLDGLVNDPELDPGDTDVLLNVVLYSTTNFVFFSDRPTLEFEFGATPLTQSASVGGGEASVFLRLDHTNPFSDSAQLSIDVATGQEFYLWALLRSEAESGNSATSADAFNTATMSFLGSPNLVPASVPIPAAAWLFASGILALVGFARRQRW